MHILDRKKKSLYRLRDHCKNMEEGSTKVNNIVARVMVLRRYAHPFFFGSFCFSVTFISAFLVHVMLYFSTSNCLDLLGAQSDEQCCNSCEEVREAYKKKGWALTNPDLIDQVYQLFYLDLFIMKVYI